MAGTAHGILGSAHLLAEDFKQAIGRCAKEHPEAPRVLPGRRRSPALTAVSASPPGTFRWPGQDDGPCRPGRDPGHDRTWSCSSDAGSTVIAMTAPHPHSAADLALAPVLIGIERNLARLRDSEDLEYAFVMQLNDDDSWYPVPGERARRVQMIATRNVELHGWTVTPTRDLQGLAVSHGEYTVSIMLGRQLAGYVEHGPQPGRRRDSGPA